jgi:plastocyanin
MNNKLLIVGLILAVILVSGCAGSQKSPTSQSPEPQSGEAPAGQGSAASVSGGGTKTIHVTIDHTAYSPATITVNKGDHVKILASTGVGTSRHNHGITIDEYVINQAILTEDKNTPTVIEFDATKAGTFKIWCKTCEQGIFGAEHPKIEGTLVVK